MADTSVRDNTRYTTDETLRITIRKTRFYGGITGGRFRFFFNVTRRHGVVIRSQLAKDGNFGPVTVKIRKFGTHFRVIRWSFSW